MKNSIAIVAISMLLSLILVAVSLTAWTLIANPAPMSGNISRKTCHPEYYPNGIDTPVVYCLCITSNNGKKTTNWTVSKEVFDRYSVGDPVRLGEH